MALYAGQYEDEFIDRKGNAVPFAEVSVFVWGTQTPAVLYADRDRAVVLANPLPTGVATGIAGLDDDANGLFWTEPGRYVMAARVDGTLVFSGPIIVNLDPEEPSSLGATGPAGATGAQGATGVSVTGATGVGVTGATGPSGATGVQGATGVGASGPGGATGATGIGASGPQGATGVQGPSGATGVTGDAGPVGATGVQGGPGATGLQGNAGPAGATGAGGAAGTTGATGIQGLAGATGAGTTGATGAAGATGVTGTAGAVGATGVTGATGAGTAGATGVQGATGAGGAAGATGAGGAVGATGTAGTAGATGTPGSAGGGVSIPYQFDTATGNADPGAGKLRVNNATQGAATAIYADLVDVLGTTWTTVIDTFDDSSSTLKGTIRLWAATAPARWIIFSVTAVVTQTGYREITVTAVAASASPLVNAEVVYLSFDRTGDKGTTGITGATGVTGAVGATGAGGAVGATGTAGTAGAAGATGVTGATGTGGAAGATGVTGATGIGATGPQGTAGAVGATGVDGAVGATGVTGATGAGGAAGATGAGGPAGATGVTGATGAGTTGATGAGGTVGATGAQGATGAKPSGQAYISAGGMSPRILNGSSPTQVAASTNGQNITYEDFIDGSTRSADTQWRSPSDWDGGTVTFTPIWLVNSTSTNPIVWQMQGRSYGDGEAFDQALGTAVTSTDTGSGTVNTVQIGPASAAMTLAGTPAAGELVHFRIFRDPSDVGDTLAATGRLIGVMINYGRV